MCSWIFTFGHRNHLWVESVLPSDRRIYCTAVYSLVLGALGILALVGTWTRTTLKEQNIVLLRVRLSNWMRAWTTIDLRLLWLRFSRSFFRIPWVFGQLRPFQIPQVIVEILDFFFNFIHFFGMLVEYVLTNEVWSFEFFA